MADTTGTHQFWQLATSDPDGLSPPRELPFRAADDRSPPTEQYNLPLVFPPAEIDLFVYETEAELRQSGVTEDALRDTLDLLHELRHSWQSLWALYGDTPAGWPHFQALRQEILQRAQGLPRLRLPLPGMAVANVLGQCLRFAVNPSGTQAAAAQPAVNTNSGRASVRTDRRRGRPSVKPASAGAAPRREW